MSASPAAPPHPARATRWPYALALSLTLGLAPFAPEPHVLGKLRWVLGGAHGMGATDIVDLALHGAPWVWLAGELTALAIARARAR